MLLVLRGLAEQFVQTDVDLARRADVTDFKTVGRKAIFHQPDFLQLPITSCMLSGMMKPADGAQT